MISSIALVMCVNGVISHEGFSAKPYKDTHGISVGYGYSMTSNPLNLPKAKLRAFKHGITEAQARQLVTAMCVKNDSALATQDWYDNLTPVRKYVMLDLTYNIGIEGTLGFKAAIRKMKSNNPSAVAKELLDSKWSKQVKSRATALATAFKTNKMV